MNTDRVTWDITIYKGRDFEMPVYFRDVNNDPIDITGWVGLAQVRETNLPDSPLILDLTVAITNAALGKATVSGAIEDTSVCQDTGSWDLVMTNASGKSDSYLVGDVTFTTVPTEV